MVREIYPAHEPTEAARRAVRTRMADRVLSRRKLVRIRRTAYGLAFTSLFVVAGMVVGPTAYAVYRLNRIAGMAADVKTAVIEGFNVSPEGHLVRSDRIVYAMGKWRIERGSNYQVYREGVLWDFNPSVGVVTKFRKPGGPFSYNNSGFSIHSMLQDEARWNWRQKIELGSGTWNGKTVERVTMTDETGRERLIVEADPASDMPLEYRSEAHTGEGWRVVHISRPVFDGVVDAKEFDLSIPKGMSVVDDAQMRKDWTAKLEKPMRIFVLDGHKIVVRDLAVNPRGHLFILYTSGWTAKDERAYTQAVMKMPRDGKARQISIPLPVNPKFEVVDSSGVAYAESRSSFQPYEGSSQPGLETGVVLSDGEILQGVWLVPLEERAWQAHRFTFKVSLDATAQAASKNWTVEFKKPNSAIVPAWMPMIGIGPKEDLDVLAEERSVQRPLLKDRNDWAAVEAGLRQDLADTFTRERRGVSYAKGTVYYELYEALGHEGKRGEALEFLKLASGQPLYPNQYPTNEIDQAMKREGLR